MTTNFSNKSITNNSKDPHMRRVKNIVIKRVLLTFLVVAIPYFVLKLNEFTAGLVKIF